MHIQTPQTTQATQTAVLVIGEALIDIVHEADGQVRSAPGGSPANVALTLGRLGRSARLWARVGDDAEGIAIRSWLQQAGVPLDQGLLAGVHTSTAVARLDETGVAHYDFDLRWEFNAETATPAGVIHTGSIATVLNPGADAVLDYVRTRREVSLVTFDPNIRPSLVEDRAATIVRVETMVTLADVVKASDEDLAWLYPGDDIGAVAARWRAEGPAVVVVTTGGSGAELTTAEGRRRVEAVRVDVVDTVGAGDTVMGALIDGLLGEGIVGVVDRSALSALSLDRLGALLHRSVVAAGITVTRAGADPPTADELAARLRDIDERA